MRFQVIPIIRIFDEIKAREFYVDFLGLRVDWEHRFDVDFPIYMQLSRKKLVIHLSEHSGDGSPGTKLIVNTSKLDELFDEVSTRDYPFSRPTIEVAPWGARVFEVTDPFSNRLVFNEQ